MAGEYLASAMPEHLAQAGRLPAPWPDAFLDLDRKLANWPHEDDLNEVAPGDGHRPRPSSAAGSAMWTPDQPGQMHAILNQIGTGGGRAARSMSTAGVAGRTGTVVGCQLVEYGLSAMLRWSQLRPLWTRMSDDKRRRKPYTLETQAQRDYVLGWGNPCPNPRNRNGTV